jgi:carotenoid cleavage dioxygenase-like enzyme
MVTVERRGEFDSVVFAVKKSRLDRNELLLAGGLDDESDLTELVLEFGITDETSSGRPHFLRCCLNSSSFSRVSRISRAIKDSE